MKYFQGNRFLTIIICGLSILILTGITVIFALNFFDLSKYIASFDSIRDAIHLEANQNKRISTNNLPVETPSYELLQNIPEETFSESDRFVDQGNPNAKDNALHGSIDLPWKTLAFAFRHLQPGQTLFIRGGTYENDRIKLREENTGEVGKPITIKPFPGETVVLKNGKEIRFQGANWWIIDGLILDQFEGIKIGLHENLGYERTVAAEDITIRNCEFRNGDQTPLTINYGKDILIENNYFHHIRPGKSFSIIERETNAVNLRYIGDNIIIRNNKFEDIGSDGVHLGSDSYIPGSDIGAVEISGNEFWVNRPYNGILGNVGENGIDVKKCRGLILISENQFHGFRPTTPEQDASGAHGDGLVIHSEAQNIIIERNLFYDNTAHLNIAKGEGTGTRNITVRNNIFKHAVSSDNSGDFRKGSALQVRSAMDVYVYHNTFYDNPRYLVSAHISLCYFKNNIVIGGDDKVHLQSSEWEADYNAWSQTTDPVPEILQGPHDVNAGDLRLDENLAPLPDSPVVLAGQNVGIIGDFDGRARGNPPDLGALEYVSDCISK